MNQISSINFSNKCARCGGKHNDRIDCLEPDRGLQRSLEQQVHFTESRFYILQKKTTEFDSISSQGSNNISIRISFFNEIVFEFIRLTHIPSRPSRFLSNELVDNLNKSMAILSLRQKNDEEEGKYNFKLLIATLIDQI